MNPMIKDIVESYEMHTHVGMTKAEADVIVSIAICYAKEIHRMEWGENKRKLLLLMGMAYALTNSLKILR